MRTTLLHLTHWSASRLCMIFLNWHSLSLRKEATQKMKPCVYASNQRSNLKKEEKATTNGIRRKKSSSENTRNVHILCRLKCLCLMDRRSFGVWYPRALQPSPPHSGGYFAVQRSRGRTVPASLVL